MSRIAKNIADGAMSFLKAEYKILSVFVLAYLPTSKEVVKKAQTEWLQFPLL